MEETIKKVGPFVVEMNVSIADIVSVITLITIILGGIFALYKWSMNSKLKRAEYIDRLTNKLRNDECMKKVILLFDYGSEWYSKEFHGSGELEENIDKTLSYFSYICFLKREHIISKKEFMFFQYETERILRNGGTCDYLYNLYHFSRKNKTAITFHYLFEYAEREKLIDKDFYNKDAWKQENTKYHKNLNF